MQARSSWSPITHEPDPRGRSSGADTSWPSAHCVGGEDRTKGDSKEPPFDTSAGRMLLQNCCLLAKCFCRSAVFCWQNASTAVCVLVKRFCSCLLVKCFCSTAVFCWQNASAATRYARHSSNKLTQWRLGAHHLQKAPPFSLSGYVLVYVTAVAWKVRWVGMSYGDVPMTRRW